MIDKLVEKAAQKIPEPRFIPSLYQAGLASLVVAAFMIPVLLVAIPIHPFLNGMAAQPKGKAKPQMRFGQYIAP